MRYGVISDIHGNLEAFDAALEALSRENVDVFLCLGDIVGYGASPNECLSRIWSLTPEVIAGNHDYAAVGKMDIIAFNHVAAEAALWTMQHLNRTGGHYLRELPLTRQYDHLLAVHAGPSHPEQWPYILSTDQARHEFSRLPDDVRVCLIGHTHIPVIFEHNDTERTCTLLWNRCVCRPDRRYIVNVGSVGQPRDGNPEASYAVYDTGTGVIEIKRTAYDIETAQKKIRRAGLPDALADRLRRGQ